MSQGEDMNDIKASLEGDIISLLRDEPFWGHIILAMKRMEDRGVDTMGVGIRDGLTLRYNPEGYFSYSLRKRKAILVHEALHVLNRHFARRDDIVGGKSIFRVLGGDVARAVKKMHERCLYGLFNYAADASVNPCIEDMPEDSVFPEGLGLPPGLSLEEYFAKLLEQASRHAASAQAGGISEQCPGEGNNGSGGCQGQTSEKDAVAGGGKSQEGAGGSCPACSLTGGLQGKVVDDHSGWQGSQADVETANAVVVSIVRECHERGFIPGRLMSMVEDILQPRVDWRMVLRAFISSSRSSETRRTWLRVNRRLPHVLKGKKHEERFSLVVAVDTSSSVSDRMLEEFSAEIDGISAECEELTVIECDTKVERSYRFEGKIRSFSGRGGTAFTPVFDHLSDSKNGLNPDAVIYLTDGYGDNPKPFRKAPVLWAVTTGGKRPADWGHLLFLPE